MSIRSKVAFAVLLVLTLAPPAVADGIFNGGAALRAVWSAITGDCTASNGSLTCTKTNGTAFGALATVTPGAGVATLLGGASSGTGGPVGKTSPSIASPTLTGTVTNPDSSTVTSSGIGSLVALGVGETAPASGNVNISGNFQIAGTTQLTSGTRPTKQVFTSGSGTYTRPAGAQWIEVTMVGGGSGGGGGNNASASTAGGSTCWNTSGAACTSPVYSAGGGSTANAGTAGGGGSPSGACDWSVPGGTGSQFENSVSGTIGSVGGSGGASSLGGAGNSTGNNGAGGSAATNTGSGGAGGGTNATASITPGAGGGAGATCHFIIDNPAGSYTYAVGAGGGGATAGTNGQAGGNGATGIIIVYEHYGS